MQPTTLNRAEIFALAVVIFFVYGMIRVLAFLDHQVWWPL